MKSRRKSLQQRSNQIDLGFNGEHRWSECPKGQTVNIQDDKCVCVYTQGFCLTRRRLKVSKAREKERRDSGQQRSELELGFESMNGQTGRSVTCRF